MIPWKRTPDATITVGPCQLSVSEVRGNSDQRWLWATLSFGEFSAAPMDECLEQWPKRAIKLAHQAVRELDRKLKELDE